MLTYFQHKKMLTRVIKNAGVQEMKSEPFCLLGSFCQLRVLTRAGTMSDLFVTVAPGQSAVSGR